MGETGKTDIPFLGKIWRDVYLAVPRINFPGSKLSVSFSLTSAFFLILVRFLSTQILRHFFLWPEGDDSYAAASVAGVVHSSLLCPGLLVAFLTHRYSPSQHLSKAPHWWQEMIDALLQFCTGYMIYDGIFIVFSRLDTSTSWIPAFTTDDYLFLGHHFMTTTYMTQARAYKAGHMSAMMCMLLGEASNPMMNAWFISSKAVTLDCCDGAIAQELHRGIEIVFAITYLAFRVLIGPVVCAHMSWSLLFSKDALENLPVAVRFFWNFMIWAVILGSYSWIVFCQSLLTKHWGGATNDEL